MDLIGIRDIRIARARADLQFDASTGVLGGGTWLYSEPQDGLTSLVDLTGFGWPAVERRPHTLTLAATCSIQTLRELPDSPLFQPCSDALLASWKIQRFATVGGNLALAIPAGPMIALAIALDATLLLWTATAERRVRAADFVLGVRATALEPGEIIRAIELPTAALAGRVAFRRIALSPLGRTGALVAARRDADGTTVFALAGGTTRAHELRFATAPTAAELAGAIDGIRDWYRDPHGTPDWRRAMSLLLADEARHDLNRNDLNRNDLNGQELT